MRRLPLLVLVVSLLASAFVAASCGNSSESSVFPDGSTSSDDAGNPSDDASNDGSLVGMTDDGPYGDFPSSPILDDPDGGAAAPPNSASLFGGAQSASSGGPCLMEPEVGAMFPRNWLRPRFRWIGFGALAQDPGLDAGPADPNNLFELRIHADNQTNDLVVYTTASEWTMPADMWNGLRKHSAGVPMTVTLRGGVFDGSMLTGVALGVSGPISIAPVDAPGTIVYWTSTSGGPGFDAASAYNPALKGFHIGDESVSLVLTPAMMNPGGSSSGTYQCLGCHTSTPDGQYVTVSARDHNPGGPPTNIALRSADGGATLPAASYVTPTAQALLNRVEQDYPSYSKAHFQTGDRIAVTMYSPSQSGPFEIAWTDLETNSPDAGWGVFARTGDTQHAALASLSHDGYFIVYVSTPDSDTSGTIVNDGDLYTIPYGNRQGGTAQAVAGASDPNYIEAYPSFSPDDNYIAFTRDPPFSTTNTSTYDNPAEEVFAIPSVGGTPTRLKANDAPACAGIPASRGLYNSWPKWSPAAQKDSAGNTYYFLVFSSQRNYGSKRFGARLYVTPMVVDPTGKITTYSALYLWNQPENEDNHSPVWDEFQIAPPPHTQ